MQLDFKVLDKVRTEIVDSGRDTRYSVDAYMFVIQGLYSILDTLPFKRPISGQELAIGLATLCYTQFGLMSLSVLEKWGISTTQDFGNIVYNLIDIDLMSKNENDKLEDFFNVFELQSYFAQKSNFVIDRDFIAGFRGV